MNGYIFPVKEGFSGLMAAWYEQLHADTSAMQEFCNRGLSRAVTWASGRLVDAAEEMLAAYRRNDNPGDPGHRSLLPVVIVGMAKDYTPTMGDKGRQTPGRRMVKIEDDTDTDTASIYGYRQAMGDIRAQVVIMAPDEPTARSLAIQLGLWLGEFKNRRFKAAFTWGQYTVQMPVMLENPDVAFMDVQTDQKNITILACDMTLTATFPFFDAPKSGEQNDGSSHNPPGYPVVVEVNATDKFIPWNMVVTEAGVQQLDPR